MFKNGIVEDLLLIINSVSKSNWVLSDLYSKKSFVNDLNFDSLSLVELIVNVESHYKIVIEDELLDFDNIDSIKNMIDIINSKVE